METSAIDRAQAADQMPADLAGRVTAFARACKAAARSVALYPGEHPAVASALEAVTAAAGAAAALETLQLAVFPDTLKVAGRSIPRPDAAVAELAGILYRHQIGQLVVHPGSDPALWRRFLLLLARAVDDIRASGGIAKAWAAEGDERLEIRTVDYYEMLRSRARGDKATWEAILAGCLEGAAFSLDDEMIELLAGVVEDPDTLAALIEAVEARLPGGDPARQNPAVVASLLQAVVRFVESSAPGQAGSIMDAIAAALTKLPVNTLASIIEIPRAATRPGLGRFIQGLLGRVSDASVASLVAGEVQAGRGLATRLAEVVYDFSPDPARRVAILGQTRALLEERGATDGTALALAWQQTEQKFTARWNSTFDSDTYKHELGRVFHRAVDLVRDHSDPPELLESWRGTVDDERVRLHDAALLTGLMSLREDPVMWGDLAGLVLQRINACIVLGDLPTAALLVENLKAQSDQHRAPAIRAAAADAFGAILTPSTMKYVASHLDTTDPAVVKAARRLCMAFGTAVVGLLAEALSVEDRDRRRRHLADILVGFGPPGREIIERLCHSSNAAVRRTAVLLLKESGGRDVLPELAALMHDAEPHVQREATRALAELAVDEADDAIVDALRRGPERTRTCLLGALGSLAPHDARRVWSRILRRAPRRGEMWAVHTQAVERLGALGGRESVEALEAVLERRSLPSPFKTAALHRRSIDALARIGTAEARAALEAAASHGPWLARAAARAQLGGGTHGSNRQGRHE